MIAASAALRAAPAATGNAWGARVGVVVVLVLLLGGCYLVIGRRQRHRLAGAGAPGLSLAPPPPPPDHYGEHPLEERVPGVCTETTTEGAWLTREVVPQLGASGPALLTVDPAGVLIDRGTEPGLYIPTAELRGAHLAPATTGRARAERLVVIVWEHDGRRLDTGFAPQRPADPDRLVHDITTVIAEGRPA